MKNELLQPAATLTAALIESKACGAHAKGIQEHFVRVYRALEAAQKQIAEEDSKPHPVQEIDVNTLKPIVGHGAR